MGTPDLNLRGTMRLFHAIGLDGIEIRCTVDGQMDTERISPRFLACVKEWQEQYELPIACLTPYYRDFLQGEESEDFLNLKKTIDVAGQLSCPHVRVYGGVDPADTDFSREENWNRSVAALQKLGAYAAHAGVRLCVETHIGSLTMTAADTARFIDDINHDAVGVLLDFAWVHLAGQESIQETLSLLGPKIFHCHVKDWHIHSRTDHSQNRGCLMGWGDIPWVEFLQALVKSGYEGWLSDEYEKYWRDEELPPAQEGMRSNMSFMKGVLGDVRG